MKTAPTICGKCSQTRQIQAALPCKVPKQTPCEVSQSSTGKWERSDQARMASAAFCLTSAGDRFLWPDVLSVRAMMPLHGMGIPKMNP